MIELIDLNSILPNEEHDKELARRIAKSMLDTRRWIVPIVLEKNSLSVMDGHHRLAAARLIGLRLVPSLLLEYTVVHVVSSREGYVVTPDAIIERAVSHNLYPVKTTKHVFPFRIQNCNVPLKKCWIVAPRSAES